MNRGIRNLLCFIGKSFLLACGVTLVLLLVSKTWAGTLSLPRVSTGDTITASTLNDPRASIEAVINGGIENVNISATAAIDEDKVGFKSGGHDHGGGAEGTAVVGVALEGYVTGLGISVNTGDTSHDVDIAVGRATDSTDSTNIVVSGTLTVSLDVQGANGMDDNDDVANDAEANTWYDVLVIQTSDGATQAGYFNKNGTSMNCPSGYSNCTFRVIGSVYTDGSKNLTHFVQSGNGRDRLYTFDAVDAGVSVLSGGTQTTLTSFSISAAASPSAYMVWGTVGHADTTATCILSSDSAIDMTASGGGGNTITAWNSMKSGLSPFSLPVLTAQTLWYDEHVGGSTGCYVRIHSYVEGI